MPLATRITDLHTCPLTPPAAPATMILTGSATVFIEGLPAARVTDALACVNPPDAILMGSPTVVIEGKLAARVGDLTAHLGAVTTGCKTVTIG